MTSENADLVLTDEQQEIIEAGDAATRLLSDPYFQHTLQRLRETYSDGILSSKPNEQDLRESFYLANAALSDLQNVLYGDVLVRDELLSRLRDAGDDHTSQE